MGSDWVVGVGGWESDGGSVERSVGAGMGGGGSDPTYLQSNNKHTRNNQCKMIMGNINTKGTHCRFGIAGNLGVVLAWLAACEHAATHTWGGHHMDEA